ncbi:unnamed protein product [Leptosia nina]|uniref:Uncharacterized protein n=1 Tax=Leptosia nina TaxID=320188 RepID=A0AAV1J9C5_9NEOP
MLILGHFHQDTSLPSFRSLSWFGQKKFKSKDDIPKYVTSEVIDRARSQARIKLSNILMALTVLGSAYAIWSGKNAAKRGESVQQMNLDWHKQYQEEFKKKETANQK